MACRIVTTIHRVVGALCFFIVSGDAVMPPLAGKLCGLSPIADFGHQTIVELGVSSSLIFIPKIPRGVVGLSRTGANFLIVSIVQR